MCDVIQDEGLGTVFFCSGAHNYCDCGAPFATHLCDVIVDMEKAQADPSDPDAGRCSTPLCDRCRWRVVEDGEVYDLCYRCRFYRLGAAPAVRRLEGSTTPELMLHPPDLAIAPPLPPAPWRWSDHFQRIGAGSYMEIRGRVLVQKIDGRWLATTARGRRRRYFRTLKSVSRWIDLCERAGVRL